MPDLAGTKKNIRTIAKLTLHQTRHSHRDAVLKTFRTSPSPKNKEKFKIHVTSNTQLPPRTAAQQSNDTENIPNLAIQTKNSQDKRAVNHHSQTNITKINTSPRTLVNECMSQNKTRSTHITHAIKHTTNGHLPK